MQLTSGENAAIPHAGVFDTSVARNGRQLVVWRAAVSDGENARLWGRVVDPAGAPTGARFAISDTAPDGSHDSVIAGAVDARSRRGEFLVSWTEGGENGLGTRVMARRIDGEGRALSEPFTVASQPRFTELGNVDVAYGKRQREFVVVFNARDAAGYAIYASRVAGGAETASKGRRVSARRASLAERPASASVAYDPGADRFLAVWRGFTAGERGDTGRDAYARTLPGAAVGQLGRTRRISSSATAGGISLNPDVVYNAAEREYAATWTGGRGLDNSRVYIRRIAPNGRPRQTPALVEGDGAHTSHIEAAPSGRYLVTFNRVGPREDDQTVIARRVGTNLEVHAPRPVPTEAAVRASNGGVAYSVAVGMFVVAWAETSEERQEGSVTPPRYDIFTRTL